MNFRGVSESIDSVQAPSEGGTCTICTLRKRRLATGYIPPEQLLEFPEEHTKGRSTQALSGLRVSDKVFTIPHSTLDTYLSQSYGDAPQRWWYPTNAQFAGIIAHDRKVKSTTIEGSSSTGDTSIGGSDLHLTITAHQTDTERFNDNSNNRGGGGGGVSVSCGGQSPPTPTVGKTLLNTSANLLPITTASDTFNNLKNLVKIDKGSAPGNNNSGSGGSGFRPKSSGGGGGYKSNGPLTHIGSPTSGEGRNISNGPGSGAISGGVRSGAAGASGHFSTGYSKNSAKIRQHDSDVSPRPRRSYQSDSSSSRYYNKNSDILGQSVKSSGPGNGALGSNSGRGLIGKESSGGRSSFNADGGARYSYNAESGGRSLFNAEIGRRNYQGTDGGYGNRNINSAPGGNYRQQQSTRYENGNGNGQQRSYGTTSNAGYSNQNKSSYGSRGIGEGNVNSRVPHKDEYGNNYRDYEDTPRSRYAAGNNNSNGSGSNTNSLERTNNGRFKPAETSSGNGLLPAPSSVLRQGNAIDSYERSATENRAQNNRSPPIRGGNAGGTPSSSVNSASSSSRGISPNSSSAALATQHPSPSPTPPPAAGRWVPPSLRPQHGLTQSEKNDAVFRKVRGILNKLTPEKFQELSDDLLKLDLNSILILNGVILLIFDKALDEPKYSSMYAQLCKRLSEEAPSFEKDPNSSCTFLRLLIAVCRDKFNNRLKRDSADNDNNNQFNKVHRPQASALANENDTDEEERRHLAKQRMLGNVKFIGELNKLDMLSKNVLHQCIMELLDKKKKRSATPQEMCEDMECLAQLLKTCGKNLDSEQGKELMNQYFETLERRSKSTDYPPRIRFMLKDVIELRENNWIPRKVATTEGPVPIKQIRTDDDTLIRTPFANRNRDMRNNDRDSDSWMNRFHLNLQPGFNDMIGSLSLTGASPIMSPFNSGNSGRSYNNRDRNTQSNNYNNRFNKHNNQNHSGGNRDDGRSGGQHMGRGEQSNSQYGGGNQMMNSKELAPRFKRNLMSTNQDPVENLQMRPAANSLLFKAASQNQKLPTMLPMSTPPGTGVNSSSSNGAQNKEQQFSNAQYPLLGTPTSHLTNPARPSSTPSAEYDNKSSQIGLGMTVEKGLKSTSSSPNFGAAGIDNQGGNGAGNVESSVSESFQKKTNTIAAEQQLITKHGSVEKTTGPAAGSTGSSAKQLKKDKFNKEEVLKKTAAYIKEKFFYEVEDEEESSPANDTTLVNNQSDEQQSNDSGTGSVNTEPDDNEANKSEHGRQFTELVEGFLDLKLPEKCMKDVCLNIVMDVLDRAEERYLDRVVAFLQALRRQCNIKPNIFLEVFKQVINKMNEREALNPRIATHVAGLLCRAVNEGGLLKLTDIANYTDNGQHYPLFLLVLQQLHKTIGKEALEEKFRNSKIDLMNSLPEADRNKTRLAEILDDRNLAFLYPLLKVQAEMMKQLTSDPNPSVFYKWIKANVDLKYYKDPGFINALMTVLLKFITQETTLTEGTDIKKHPDRAIIEKEELLLLKYCQILQSFLGGSTELQLIAVYALQVFCYNNNFPKGMLCRWFKYLYEAEVIEEETFIKWKEEISDKYPGKGTALFQVNNWLTWLQEAESEDEDD